MAGIDELVGELITAMAVLDGRDLEFENDMWDKIHALETLEATGIASVDGDVESEIDAMIQRATTLHRADCAGCSDCTEFEKV